MDMGGAVDTPLRDLSAVLGSGSSTPKATLPGSNPMSSPSAPTTWEGEAAQLASLTAGQVSMDARTDMNVVLTEWAGPYPPGAPHAAKINELYQDLAELQTDIAAHNSHSPSPDDPAAVAACNDEYDELMSELLEVQAQSAVYGIELTINPPDQVGNL